MGSGITGGFLFFNREAQPELGPNLMLEPINGAGTPGSWTTRRGGYSLTGYDCQLFVLNNWSPGLP